MHPSPLLRLWLLLLANRPAAIALTPHRNPDRQPERNPHPYRNGRAKVPAAGRVRPHLSPLTLTLALALTHSHSHSHTLTADSLALFAASSVGMQDADGDGTGIICRDHLPLRSLRAYLPSLHPAAGHAALVPAAAWPLFRFAVTCTYNKS